MLRNYRFVYRCNLSDSLPLLIVIKLGNVIESGFVLACVLVVTSCDFGSVIQRILMY